MRMALILAASAFLLGGAPASAADASGPMVVSAPSDGEFACTHARALGRIQSRFAWAENSLWRRGFVIATIGNARPSGHPYAEPGLVKRDYCVADAVMTNGSSYPVHYTIEHGLGFVGIGVSVDFCVLGLDPWHVHDGSCRTVR